MCNETPTLKHSVHIFLDLSTMQPRVAEYLERQWARADNKWSPNAQNIARAWLKEGLHER